jgi:hypothetical protein
MYGSNFDRTERIREQQTKRWTENLITVLVAFGLVLGCCLIPFTIASNQTTAQFDGVVIDKPIIDGDTYFTVRLENGSEEVFQNSNNPTVYKFNKADLISQIKIGYRYRFVVNWFRIKSLNQYRNIISATPLPSG